MRPQTKVGKAASDGYAAKISADSSGQRGQQKDHIREQNKRHIDTSTISPGCHSWRGVRAMTEAGAVKKAW